MPRSPLPQVAIVGRPNVGKSAIFNRLAGRRIAIVHDQPGVTRDRIATQVSKAKVPYELTDTGGIGALLDDGFADQVRAEADIAIHAADLILFVVDAREGIHPIDRELASLLRQEEGNVILLANKVDTAKTDSDAAEFSELGFDHQWSISAAHGRNFNELESAIAERLAPIAAGFESEEGDSEENPVKIAIVGRPNVGKSSLINAILNDERSIVSDVAGTTRDAVDVPYQRDGQHFTLIDTAGIRQRTRRDTSVEVFSVMRSERSIRRADLCLLVIDASSGVVSQDRRIAKMVIDAHKPCIVLLNKFDLFHPGAHFQDRIDQFREELGDDLFFLPYAPKVAISAKNRQYLGKIFKAINDVIETANNPVATGVLNRLLQNAITRNPPPVRQNKRLKLLYATQKREDRPSCIPVPEYILFVNYANLLTRTYERFLENQIRKEFPMEGLPFVFRTRSRTPRELQDGKSSQGGKASAKKKNRKR
ncbi:MAG: ribosome biogenesis GTPase Der [Verrucomicrobiales bacterium]|nr:ribosome biogenesis GTPase Der [Verrucomicrobiales bacterium]